MKRFSPSVRCLLSAAVLTGVAVPASGAVFTGSWTGGFATSGPVPDGTATGWFDVRALPIPSDHTVLDVNVSISLSGGWNGDLYAYLTNPAAPGVAVLLNRPGRTGGNPFGYSDAALTITLDDGALNDTHTYQSVSGYATLIGNGSAWQPDGRNVNPFTVDGTEARTSMLSVFNGISPGAGGWTLFVADLASGSQAAVSGWGLTVVTVPEPSAASAAALILWILSARRKR